MKGILLLKRAAFFTIGIGLNVAIINAQPANEPEIEISMVPKTGVGGVAEGRIVWSELTSNNAGQYAVIAMLRAPWGDDYVKPTNANYLNAKDVFTLSGLPPETAVEIYDISGNLALSLPSPDGETIDVSDLPGGIYLVKAGASVCKIIKSR
jgi:hypothetical protein